MGRPMRLELTREGLLVKLANRYTTKGAQLKLNIDLNQKNCFTYNLTKKLRENSTKTI